MNLLKSRIDATNEKLKELKASRKLADKTKRQEVKHSRADKERKKLLVGEAVLARVASGEWDEAEFRSMMDNALFRPADRDLFGLDEP